MSTPILDRLHAALAEESREPTLPFSTERRWRMSPDVADAILVETGGSRTTLEDPGSRLFGLPLIVDEEAKPAFVAIETLTPEGNGVVVHDAFLDAIREQYLRDGPYRPLFPRLEFVPMTRGQRLRAALWDLRRRIAYAIYPFTEGDE